MVYPTATLLAPAQLCWGNKGMDCDQIDPPDAAPKGPLEVASLDESWVGDGAAQAVHDGVAIIGPRLACWLTVSVSAGPRETSPTPLLVIQVGPFGGEEVTVVSHCAELPAVDEVQALGAAKNRVRGQTWVEGDSRGLEGDSTCT